MLGSLALPVLKFGIFQDNWVNTTDADALVPKRHQAISNHFIEYSG